MTFSKFFLMHDKSRSISKFPFVEPLIYHTVKQPHFK